MLEERRTTLAKCSRCGKEGRGITGNLPRSRSSSPLTFGLGNAQKVDELTITWLSGKATTLTDLKADQIYQVNEESGVAK
ncbi:MAG: ASPIC/UnbV domain-containing protein [Isosphaeraceae bacterium]